MKRMQIAAVTVAVLAVLSFALWGGIDHANTSDLPSSAAAPTNMASHTADTPKNQALREWIYQSHAGAGSSIGWCLTGATLQPCADLRARFDYYLIAIHRPETDYTDIRRLVESDAKSQATSASGKILALFDRYWLLQNYAWKQPWLEHDPSTWPAAWTEREKARRDILGAAWAQVFYAKERQAYIDATGQPPAQWIETNADQTTQALTPEEMVAEQWPDISEEEKIQRIKALSHLPPSLNHIQDSTARKMAIAQAQWKRIQNEASLSEAEKKTVMEAFIQDTFEPNEYDAVASHLKLE